MKYLFVAAGGSIGAMLRYLISGMIQRQVLGVFPLGVLWVNASGCFLGGFLWEILERTTPSTDLRLFVFVGILGGYTTFSSFGLESFHLARNGEIKLAIFNVIANNVLCLLCVYLGFLTSRSLLNLFK